MRVPLREEKRIQITKIRDSEAGGLPSVKNEDFFHGFMPREQVRGSNAGGGGIGKGKGTLLVMTFLAHFCSPLFYIPMESRAGLHNVKETATCYPAVSRTSKKSTPWIDDAS